MLNSSFRHAAPGFGIGLAAFVGYVIYDQLAGGGKKNEHHH